jgi:hypothetical protein
MVKFSKKAHKPLNEESGLNWQQLMGSFQNQSVEEAIKNIMDQVTIL